MRPPPVVSFRVRFRSASCPSQFTSPLHQNLRPLRGRGVRGPSPSLAGRAAHHVVATARLWRGRVHFSQRGTGGRGGSKFAIRVLFSPLVPCDFRTSLPAAPRCLPHPSPPSRAN